VRSSKLSSVTLLQSSNGRRELLEQQQHQQRLSTSDYAHGDEASQQKLINGTRLIDMVFRSLKHIGDFTDALIDMVTFPELFEYLHVFLAFIAGDWPVYFQVRRMASSTGDDLVLTILTRPAFADACNRADIGADENDKRLQFAHAVVDRIRNVLAVPGPLHMSLNGTETCGKLLAFVLRDAFKQAHSGKELPVKVTAWVTRHMIVHLATAWSVMKEETCTTVRKAGKHTNPSWIAFQILMDDVVSIADLYAVHFLAGSDRFHSYDFPRFAHRMMRTKRRHYAGAMLMHMLDLSEWNEGDADIMTVYTSGMTAVNDQIVETHNSKVTRLTHAGDTREAVRSRVVAHCNTARNSSFAQSDFYKPRPAKATSKRTEAAFTQTCVTSTLGIANRVMTAPLEPLFIYRPSKHTDAQGPDGVVNTNDQQYKDAHAT
jgi:hypothetical protein